MAAAEGELRIWKVSSWSWLRFSQWWWRWLGKLSSWYLASSTSTPRGSLRMTPMMIRCDVQLQSIWMLISKEYSFSPWMVNTTMQIVKNHYSEKASTSSYWLTHVPCLGNHINQYHYHHHHHHHIIIIIIIIISSATWSMPRLERRHTEEHPSPSSQQPWLRLLGVL